MRLVLSGRIKKPSRRWAYSIMATMQVLAILGSSNVVNASIDNCDITADPTVSSCLSNEDLYTINTNTPSYDPTDIVCSGTATAVPASLSTSGPAVVVPPGQGSGTWNSQLTPPYTLEQFMTELLKDIATKRGITDVNSVVTQQHIIGLIALAWGEGGGITNNDFWNPFNNGLNAPDLVAGSTSSSGVQAFKSFDAGVEATARVMTGDTQGRLGVTLSIPSSTADDFLNSWLDFPPHSPYPQGHYPWAEASDPSSKYYEPGYKQARLDLISQVTKNYDSMASTVMRGQASDPADKHDTTKLKFHTDGSISTGVTLAANPCAAAVPSTGAFFDTAKAYAWPTYHTSPYCAMTPAYAAAVTKALPNVKAGKDYVGGGNNTVSTATAPAGDCTTTTGRAGIDCGGFVTRVFRDSGADPSYNSGTGGVDVQYAYVAAHPTLYKRVSNPKKTTDLQPGDIYFESDLGHTFIFVGSAVYPGTKYNAVSASYSTTGQSWRTPMASNVGDGDVAGGIWYRPLFSLSNATATATGSVAA